MQVIIDDAGDVPADLAEELDIRIIPINIIFGQEEFLSGVTMDHKAFYEKVVTVDDHNFPKTSQPTPYQFEEVYRELIGEGKDEFLAVTVSEKLSGTYDSAVAAARALEGQATFHVFDSKSGSAAQGLMAVEAARMAQAGESYEAIDARLCEMRNSQSIYFLIDSLDFAVRGGRVGLLRSTMASLLNIKPIMKVEDGLIVEGGKVRTYKKAVAFIVDAVRNDVGDRPVKMAAIHSNDEEAGQALLEKARAALNCTESFLVDMSISVAINLGPGALGLIAIPEAA
ncbi:MAG: DegV family protein [Candidatus Promineifilaceae bacterium]|nr:DegV family protein [Candidatus Promineifilaceae bacterium]